MTLLLKTHTLNMKHINSRFVASAPRTSFLTSAGLKSVFNLPIKQLTVAFFCLMISACSAHYGAAKIVSHPAGAEVINMEDGTILGVTPTESWWKYSSDNNQHLALRFKKDGYHEKVTSFWLSMRHSSAEDARKNPQLVEVSLQKRGD